MEFLSVVYLIAGICSSTAMTVVLKIFRNQTGNRYGIILGNYLTCVLIAFLMIPEKSSIFHPDITTLICGIVGGFLFVAGLVSMQSSIRINGAILSSAFSKMGLIVPLLISVIFLGEKFRILQIPGVILIFAAFWLISTDKESFQDQKDRSLPSHVILLLMVLLSYGGADSMAKIFEHLGQASENQLYFLILFLFATILTLVLLLMEYKRTGAKIKAKEFFTGVLVGIPNYFASYLLLLSLNGLPSLVVYPCYSAGTLLLVTIIGAVFFKEKPGKKAWVGLAFILLALIFLNI